jgi:hypothetical protein
MPSENDSGRSASAANSRTENLMMPLALLNIINVSAGAALMFRTGRAKRHLFLIFQGVKRLLKMR